MSIWLYLAILIAVALLVRWGGHHGSFWDGDN
jgi:hypothetical protein